MRRDWFGNELPPLSSRDLLLSLIKARKRNGEFESKNRTKESGECCTEQADNEQKLSMHRA
jgi:hypothetical protein